MGLNSSEPDRAGSSNQPIAVLGGSGFIGSRLSTRLAERNIPFRIGDLKQSEAFPDHWKACDIRRPEDLGELIQEGDTIVNLAAEHRDDVRPISRYHETNVEGASHVCVIARRTGVRKIVFASSVAVYGFQPFPVDENGPFAPFNEYGKTKLEAEGVYREWAAEDPSRTLVMIRPTVVFGEGNRANVYNLLRQIESGRFLMTGSGKNVKSMSYVGNIAAFLMHVLALEAGTHIFNYADGPDMDTNTLVEFIRGCLKKEGAIRRIPKPVALAGGRVLDVLAHLTGRTFPISAIRVQKFCESTQVRACLIAQTGFVPPYSLREGLTRTIQFEFPASR